MRGLGSESPTPSTSIACSAGPGAASAHASTCGDSTTRYAVRTARPRLVRVRRTYSSACPRAKLPSVPRVRTVRRRDPSRDVRVNTRLDKPAAERAIDAWRAEGLEVGGCFRGGPVEHPRREAGRPVGGPLGLWACRANRSCLTVRSQGPPPSSRPTPQGPMYLVSRARRLTVQSLGAQSLWEWRPADRPLGAQRPHRRSAEPAGASGSAKPGPEPSDRAVAADTDGREEHEGWQAGRGGGHDRRAVGRAAVAHALRRHQPAQRDDPGHQHGVPRGVMARGVPD